MDGLKKSNWSDRDEEGMDMNGAMGAQIKV